MRRLSIKYPPRLNVLNAAKTTYYITSKKGTPVKRVSFKCSICNTEGLKSKDVEVDHIESVVDTSTGFTTIEEFVNRLFCEQSNLRLICKSCHTIETNKQLKERIDERHKK